LILVTNVLSNRSECSNLKYIVPNRSSSKTELDLLKVRYGKDSSVLHEKRSSSFPCVERLKFLPYDMIDSLSLVSSGGRI
jgi:hypothetical protein